MEIWGKFKLWHKEFLFILNIFSISVTDTMNQFLLILVYFMKLLISSWGLMISGWLEDSYVFWLGQLLCINSQCNLNRSSMLCGCTAHLRYCIGHCVCDHFNLWPSPWEGKYTISSIQYTVTHSMRLTSIWKNQKNDTIASSSYMSRILPFAFQNPEGHESRSLHGTFAIFLFS